MRALLRPTFFGGISRHVREIQTGGLPVLRGGKFGALIALALAVPLVVIVRLLRPFVLVRFGRLHSERIGHFAANTEVYLCARRGDKHDIDCFDIFYCGYRVSNQQLRKMWGRRLWIWPLARATDKLNHFVPGFEKHVVDLSQYKDAPGTRGRTEVQLSFTPVEERRGQVELTKLGIPVAAPFVCFHGRDSAYLKDTWPHLDWGYHSYRDSKISNYISAADEVARRGYYAVRMGAAAEHALVNPSPMVIDYAKNSRTDFLDIYLLAKCLFFLGSTAGLYTVPRIFLRPIACANWIPITEYDCLGSGDLFIPKKLWLHKDHRFLTFREMLHSGAGGWLDSEEYERAGIEPVENTPEEITSLAIEMEERLSGTWHQTKDDGDLQRLFWAQFPSKTDRPLPQCRIGADFLRQNRDLLE